MVQDLDLVELRDAPCPASAFGSGAKSSSGSSFWPSVSRYLKYALIAAPFALSACFA